MKKCTMLMACLMVVLAALGSLCGAIVSKAQDEALYSSESRAAVALTGQDAAAYIGMTDAEQSVFAGEIVSFMKGETDAQPAVLNEKEQQHMRDVRALVQLAQKLSQGLTMLAAALAVVAAWTCGGKRKPVLLGALCGLGVLIAVALGALLALNSAGFTALFIRMHELIFTNDLWLLNPETDVLIRMMPQPLFERAAAEVAQRALGTFAVTLVMLAAIYGIFDNMIRRHLTEREKQ